MSNSMIYNLSIRTKFRLIIQKNITNSEIKTIGVYNIQRNKFLKHKITTGSSFGI